MSSGLMNPNDVIVSIRCTVFNHGPYLRQCLDGFVMQKTNFKFEAFVHDDASTDDSAAIILEYAQKFPDIIVPFIETENLYSKRNGQFQSVTYSPSHLRGKYIAMCEGDDYWTDPMKLQKQVDFLDNHPECSMVFGNAVEHWEDGCHPDQTFADLENRYYSGVELSQRWIVPTATILFRREVLLSDPLHKSLFSPHIMAGDLPLCLSCAELGSIYCINELLAVYRRVPQGFWRSLDAPRRLKMGRDRIEIYRIFGYRYKKSTIGMAFYHYMRAWQIAKEEKKVKLQMKAMWKSFILACRFPAIAIQRLALILREKHAESFER